MVRFSLIPQSCLGAAGADVVDNNRRTVNHGDRPQRVPAGHHVRRTVALSASP